jgi:hypothetical protein
MERDRSHYEKQTSHNIHIHLKSELLYLPAYFGHSLYDVKSPSFLNSSFSGRGYSQNPANQRGKRTRTKNAAATFLRTLIYNLQPHNKGHALS